MIAHNICYSTLVNGVVENIPIEKGPEGHDFVTKECFQGILPTILIELLDARKKARFALATVSDPNLKAVFDGRQKALKITANSVCGFTGFTNGKLPCLPIAKTVSSYGRRMIIKTASIVQEHFTKENRYKYDATVIYGDTDSVMIDFGNITMQKAIELGKGAASYVSKHFTPPIHFEFEKAFNPYLLISKKSYCGLLWANPNKSDRIDANGIETVRRDNCKLVQHLIQISLNNLMYHQESQSSVRLIKCFISELLQDRIDLSFLIISKSLSKDYYKTNSPHTAFAKKTQRKRFRVSSKSRR
jgi:DNA polymerase delta subunit 1